MNTILKPKTRDIRINHESIWSPNLVTGKITKNMRNEPNLPILMCFKEPKKMKNKPNFTPNAPTKHAKDEYFTPIFHSHLHLFTRQMRTFRQKMRKIRVFCKYLKQTHLTPCTTKTYTNIHTKIHFKRGVYLPFASREKMQNKPNATKLMYLKVQAMNNELPTMNCEKRTQSKNYGQDARLAPRSTGHERRATKKCKTNPIAINPLINPFTHSLIHPIMQNEPNLT